MNRTPATAPSQSADLIADLEHLTNAGFGICRAQAIDLITALRAAEAREQKLREALTFYADRHRWRSVTAPMCGCVGESSATNDSGGRARRALGGEP